LIEAGGTAACFKAKAALYETGDQISSHRGYCNQPTNAKAQPDQFGANRSHHHRREYPPDGLGWAEQCPSIAKQDASINWMRKPISQDFLSQERREVR